MRIANKTLHKIVRDLIGNLRNAEPTDPAFFSAMASGEKTKPPAENTAKMERFAEKMK